MKNIVCILLFVLISARGYGQVVAIQNEYQGDILYLCVANPLKVAVEKCSSSDIILDTDNGIIRKDEFGIVGRFHITPERMGSASVYVKRKTKNGGIKIIDTIYYKVKPIPATHPRLGGKKGGEITKYLLWLQIAPSAVVECCNFEARFLISGFTVVVFRGEREIYKRSIVDPNGARIDSTTKKFFSRQLDNKDEVIFRDIAVTDCKGNIRNFESIQFTVIDAEKFPKELLAEHGEEIITDPITGQETIHKW